MALTLPTLYKHYTINGITTGLSTNQQHFTLNNRNITIYSGALHYFRVPQEYWRDRLRKMRAAGLNSVETYIPWNLHEPQKNSFHFENSLDIHHFLKIAKEEDLFAIVRPGPFICAEWEFGGLPSWLLRTNNIKLRTSDNKFMNFVRNYFNVLLPILALLQFTNGGPIIGFQVENEYGSTEQRGKFTPDKVYLEELYQLFRNNGITELLFTSDSPTQHGNVGTLPKLFQTANFAVNPEKEFKKLGELQPNRPFMAMEFWAGWFDHWGKNHYLRNNSEFKDVLERILRYPASVNFYMFHGGTNWGFYNGANIPFNKDQSSFQPDTTSYDYDAPLSESGDYTEKYAIIKDLLKKYEKIATLLPEEPPETNKTAYAQIVVSQQLLYQDIVQQLARFDSRKIVPMEFLPINNNSGQSYGHVIYRKNIEIKPNSTLKIKGYIYDSLLVLINNKLISKPLDSPKNLNSFGYWRMKDSTLKFSTKKKLNVTLDLVVENLGRINFGHLHQFDQYKGLRDSIFLDNKELLNWTISPMEFQSDWVLGLKNWQQFRKTPGPGLYKAILKTNGTPQDTFLDMSQWCRGVVFVNGFNLGRFMNIGPQQTLFLPAPLLKNSGDNDIIVFEHFRPNSYLTFSKFPIYLTKP